MADGNIFYSSVDENLRNELNTRASAGRLNRTSGSIDFMVSKIANVELIAYRNQEHAMDDPTKYLARLGGDTTRGLDYIPRGYLNPNRDYKTTGNGQSSDSLEEKLKPKSKYNSYRIGPYIKSTNVSTSDGQMGIMQTAQIDIVIPDPVRDLDYVESVFMRPGRAVTLKLQYPESAVITKKKLNRSLIQPAVNSSKIIENLDMNTAIYNMLVISFNMSYQTNGTINVTLHLRGVSSVYTDVTCLINSAENNSANKEDTKLIDTFYQRIYKEVRDLYDAQQEAKTNPDATFNIQRAFNVTDREALNESTISDGWWWVTKDVTGKTTQVYITLGYLISFINQNIIQTKNKIVTNGLIICNPDSTKCNVVENIVSTNPYRIVLDKFDAYGTTSDNKPRYIIDNTISGSPKFRNNDGTGIPSIIYINLDLIKEIEEKYAATPEKFKVTTLLQHISDEIKNCTGGMINLQLISHPVHNDYLFYCDRNFLPKKEEVIPYPVPMGIKNNMSGSIVKDFKVDVKLPTSMQNLMYTINSGDSISEAQIAPHVNFMYNNSIIERSISADSGSITDSYTNDNAKSLETLHKEYEASYKKYNEELIKAISDYGSNPNSSDFKLALDAATKKKMQYPTKSIQSSTQMTSPIYPHEVEFTTDGIHGFRYGDVVEFNILPNRYKKFATFSIMSVVHDVNTSGMWNTTVKCIMRPYIKEN